MSLLPVESKDDWTVIAYPSMGSGINDITGTNYYMKIGMVAYSIYEKCKEHPTLDYADCITQVAEPFFLPYYDGWVTVINMYQEYTEFTEIVNFGGCFSTYGFCWFMWAFNAND